MKLKTLIAAVSLAAFGAVNAADYEVPRTEWDQPDLQGVWNFSSNIPMSRPAMFGVLRILPLSAKARSLPMSSSIWRV